MKFHRGHEPGQGHRQHGEGSVHDNWSWDGRAWGHDQGQVHVPGRRGESDGERENWSWGYVARGMREKRIDDQVHIFLDPIREQFMTPIHDEFKGKELRWGPRSLR